MIGRLGSAVGKPVAGFARGFSYPLRALRLLRSQPVLLKYVAIPFVINLLVFSLSVYFGLDLFDYLIESYAPVSGAWYAATLHYLAWVAALLVTTMVVFFSFTVVGNLIASPFNELLSERTEEMVRGVHDNGTLRLRQVLADSGRAMLVEVRKMAVFVGCMLLLLLINLLPGIGSALYAVLAPLLTLFFLVIEYMAFVLMRKQLNFARQRRYTFKRPLLMAGFGCSVFCLLAVPFVQFFCIPLAVVGATLLWCDFPMEEDAFSAKECDTDSQVKEI